MPLVEVALSNDEILVGGLFIDVVFNAAEYDKSVRGGNMSNVPQLAIQLSQRTGGYEIGKHHRVSSWLSWLREPQLITQ